MLKAENSFLWSVADTPCAAAVSARHCSEHWLSLPGPQDNLGSGGRGLGLPKATQLVSWGHIHI